MDCANMQHLGVLAAFFRAPEASLPRQFMSRLLRFAQNVPASAPPFIHHALSLLTAYNLPLSVVMQPDGKARIKDAVHAAAQRRWQAHLHSLPSLQPAFSEDTPLCMASYLCMPPFRGRQLLTQLRLHVLRLHSTFLHLSGCPTCQLPVVEDYFHFLFVCPRLQAVRDSFSVVLPLLRDDCLLQGTARLAAFIAVSRRVGPPELAEQCHLRHLGAFLAQLYRVRARHISSPPPPSLLPRV